MAEKPNVNFYPWEDFSSEEGGRGVEVIIPFQGKALPFRIRKSLTIDERQKANDAAIDIGMDKHGKPVINRQDQGAYTKEIVRLGLKFWPFEFEPGKPVPITPKNIARLDGGLLSEIAARILGTAEVDQDELTPFGKKSEEDSSLEEAADLS